MNRSEAVRRELIMKPVPEGWFTMGANWEEADEAEVCEGPERSVWVSAFEIQQGVVEVRHWKRFVEASGYSWSLWSELNEVAAVERHPVVLVSWSDCSEFANWLSDGSHFEYSLPTEAQWEKACRGTDARQVPWPNVDLDELRDRRWGAGTLRDVGEDAEVVSACGCLEMWDHVAEWCKDWYEYEIRDRGTRDPRGPANGTHRSVRGGNVHSKGWPRCSYRTFASPNERQADLGFRLVRTLPVFESRSDLR